MERSSCASTRRLGSIGSHVLGRSSCAKEAGTVTTAVRTHEELERDVTAVQDVFGPGAWLEPLCVLPNGKVFGVRISGIDVSEPLTPAQARACVQSFYRHRLLCIADQHPERLTVQGFERFANHLGAPVPHPSIQSRKEGHPALQVQTNVVGHRGNKLGQPVGELARSFHADIDYETSPITSTMMHCMAAPREPLGATEMCDLHSATLALPPELRRQASLLRVQRRPRPWFSEPQYVGKIEMARAHENASTVLHSHHTLPDRETLYNPQLDDTSSNEYSWAEGSREEMLAVVEQLNAHAKRDEFRYKHRYRRGDVFCWDNYQTLHRGPGDLVGVATMDDPEARFLHRISVKGAPSWELPRADAETWLATHVAGGYRTEWLA